MKSNPTLQTSLGFINNAQAVYYAAYVLKSALISSPPVLLQAKRVAKPAIIAQTAKPARAATAAVLGVNNTVGYAFGEIYLNSPAYPIGTAIPAIPAKPASVVVIGVDAVTALPEVKVPAVPALKGWEDAIAIAEDVNTFVITVQLPVAQSVGMAGSTKVVIGEITPSPLQATAWLAEKGSNGAGIVNDVSATTLESFLYNHAMLCEHTITDSIRVVNGISLACKTIVATVYKSVTFDSGITTPQLASIVEAVGAGS